MTRFKMRIDGHALGGAFGDNLLIGRRIIVIHFSQESVEYKMPSFLTAGILFAKTTTHATDSADFANFRPAHGIVAENMNCR